MDASRVLVVEDDRELASAVSLELAHAGYDVRIEPDGPAALSASREWSPELILLDLGLPSLEGVEVCRRLRDGSTTPIVIVTARSAIDDRVRGLDAGADDYLVKPFSLDELMARVRSALRRSRMRDGSDRLKVGDVLLDAASRTVSAAGEPVDLTRREFDLLEVFMRHPGRVLGREALLSDVWGYDFLGGSNIVDVYVGYLRRKLGSQAALIETVRGVGYAIRPPS